MHAYDSVNEAQTPNLSIVAEGAETEEQLAILRSMSGKLIIQEYPARRFRRIVLNPFSSKGVACCPALSNLHKGGSA